MDVVIELRVVQFWSEIILVISNQTRAARSFDFEITRMISDQIALHSVQLPIFTCLFAHCFFFFFIPIERHHYGNASNLNITSFTRNSYRFQLSFTVTLGMPINFYMYCRSTPEYDCKEFYRATVVICHFFMLWSSVVM